MELLPLAMRLVWVFRLFYSKKAIIFQFFKLFSEEAV
jgi:hypothetical protein